MSCNKECKCKECEFLIKNHEVVFIDDANPFNEQRHHIKAYKCYGNGQIAFQEDKLKTSKLRDDLLFYSKDKEYRYLVGKS